MTGPRDPLLGELLALAVRAGVLVMGHYAAGLRGRTKADDSPVTDADEAVAVLAKG